MVLCICSKGKSIKIKIEMEMINMNMKNTFKKMTAILGIAGVSVVSFAIPPKKLPPRKPGAEIVQPDKKAAKKKSRNVKLPNRHRAVPQEKRK